MTATDELRKLLDERGVSYDVLDESLGYLTMWQTWHDGLQCDCQLSENRFGTELQVFDLTPEQAIAATLGNEPSQMVYIVESYDSLTEGGYVEPTCYRTKQAAIRCAESLTYDGGDGVRYWARWKELKVVDE